MLDKIIEHKREEIIAIKKKYSISNLESFANEQGGTRGFANALKSCMDKQETTIIAEIKRASPRTGVLCENFEPIQIASTYMQAGATCLSILTDVFFFKGSGAILDLVRRHCMLPVLRKDFILDPYQIYESRAIGADCVLLIATVLPDDGLFKELFELSRQLNMDVLVEVHDETDLNRALELGDELDLIGINNRNLSTFDISLDTSIELSKRVPPNKLMISESGIRSAKDIATLRQSGIYAYLIGESLMRSDDPGKALSELLA